MSAAGSIADGYVIGIAIGWAALIVGAVLWAATDPSTLSSWRESWRKLPPSDPELRGQPYRRPRP